MKSRILTAAIPGLFSLWVCSAAFALDGEPYIHDPSTIIQCDGKFYTFGTGGGGLISMTAGPGTAERCVQAAEWRQTSSISEIATT
jgi:hypothetical protein